MWEHEKIKTIIEKKEHEQNKLPETTKKQQKRQYRGYKAKKTWIQTNKILDYNRQDHSLSFV